MKKKTRRPRQRNFRLDPLGAMTVAYFLLLPFVLSFTGLDKFRAPKEVFAGVFVVALAGVFAIRRRVWPLPRPDAWTALLGLGLLFGFLHAALVGESEAALRGAFQILYYGVFLLLLVEILGLELQRTVWLAGAAAISVNAVLTVLQYLGLFPLMVTAEGGELAGRLTPAGFIGDVNSGAFLFGMVCLISVPGLVLETRRGWRYAWAAIFALNLAGLAFTRTLTAILGLGLAALLWLGFHHWWAWRRADWGRRNFMYLWMAMLLAAVGGVSFSYRAGVLDRLSETAAQMGRGDWSAATAGRQPVYQITWQMIRERPLLGRGLNSFGRDFFSYRAETEYGRSPKMINQPGAFRQVHNEYLQLWEEAGLVGLILFGTLFFWPVLSGARHAFRCPDPNRSYWAGVLTIAGVFIAFTSLTFFPFHLAVTASFALLTLACLRRLTGGERAGSESAAELAPPAGGRKKWIKPVAITAAALALMVPQVRVWQANREMGVAAFLLEQAVALEGDLRRSRLYADEALGRLDRIGEPGPRLREAYNLRGSAAMLLGRHGAAIEWYQKAVRYLPSPETYTNLAAAHLAASQPDRARELLVTALHYNPSYEPAREALRYLDKSQRP